MSVGGGAVGGAGKGGSEGSVGSVGSEAKPASEIEAVGASALVDIGRSFLARRLSELGLDDGPRVFWRRPLSPRLPIRVCEDDALLVYTLDGTAPLAVIDAATGADSPPPVRDSWPAPGAGRLVSLRLDPRSGSVITGGRTHDHSDAEALVGYQFMRGDEPTWQYSDPFTGSHVWAVEWWMDDPIPPVDDPRKVVVGLYSGASRFGPWSLVGLRAEDGAHLWSIEGDAGRWRRYKRPKHPLYAGKSDHCVVLAELVAGALDSSCPKRPHDQYRPASDSVDLPICPCGRNPFDSFETFCGGCGGKFACEVLVHVFDRATGAPLFRRAWPDPDAPDTAVADVVDIRSDVLLTREGPFVRGHSLPGGRQLWSVVPPVATTFEASGRHPGSRWAWLRPSEPDAESAAPGGLFLHAATGRTLNLRGAVHHTADDHVIARDGGELICWTLPAG